MAAYIAFAGCLSDLLLLVTCDEEIWQKFNDRGVVTQKHYKSGRGPAPTGKGSQKADGSRLLQNARKSGYLTTFLTLTL